MLLLFTQAAATVEKDVTDTASLALTEASANAVSSAVTDNAALALTEESANALSSTVTDSTVLTLSESSANDLASAVMDTVSLTLTETSENALTSAVADTASLSADDVASIETFEGIDTVDDAALALSESTEITVAQAEEAFTGGFFVTFEREMARRERERRERLEAEESAQAIANARDREIAAFLHAQEAMDGERAELERLTGLVTQFADQQAESAFNERVQAAYVRALAQQNASALLAFERELRRQIEEEEFAVLMALALD